jgi:polysaccharide chain length determinant protein (PEP-CTERM system associated)
MNLDLSFYMAVFMRRFHYFTLVFTLVSAAAIATAFLLPPSYRSESVLLVEGSQIPTTLAETTIQTAAVEQLQIIEQRLLTRANLLDIAKRFNVLENIQDMTADEIVEAMEDRTEINMRSGRDEATIVRVAFTADSANTSAAVVNEYVTLILKENVEIRTRRAGQTLEFFEQEVEDLGEQLGAASARIKDFQTQNSDALPNTLDFRLNQQTQLQNTVASIAREIESLKGQKDRLVAIFNTTGTVNTNTTGVQLSPEAEQLASLRDELSRALAVLSPENPRVKLLKKQIEQLEVIVKAQSPILTDGPDADPVETMLDLQLADIDSRIKSLEDQKAQATEQLAELTESIQRTSANQIELERLQRELDVVQGQYDTAVDRLKRAATGERIEVLSKGERITVIDAAVPPSKPTKPNRTLIAAGGIFLGALLGVGAIALIETMNHAVRRPKDLVRSFGITPLTTVPYVRTPGETVMRRSVISLAILLALAGIPALLYAIHLYYPIDLILARVAQKLGVGG